MDCEHLYDIVGVSLARSGSRGLAMTYLKPGTCQQWTEVSTYISNFEWSTHIYHELAKLTHNDCYNIRISSLQQDRWQCCNSS